MNGYPTHFIKLSQQLRENIITAGTEADMMRKLGKGWYIALRVWSREAGYDDTLNIKMEVKNEKEGILKYESHSWAHILS